jgi:hypothetical protein
MEVSGQLHTQSTFYPRKESPPLLIELEAVKLWSCSEYVVQEKKKQF